MGRTHSEAVRRLGNVEIAGVADTTDDLARAFAAQIGVERYTGDYRTLLDDKTIEAVHVCTPNALHFPISRDATARRQARDLRKAARHLDRRSAATGGPGQRKRTSPTARSTICAITPWCQQIRRMREAGELGEILVVQGTYSQDWLLYDTDWNWRIDSKENGPSRCFADIGTHWCDMIEHTTGLRIKSLCADLATFHKTRKRPKGEIETFRRQDAAAGRLRRGRRSTRKTSAA